MFLHIPGNAGSYSVEPSSCYPIALDHAGRYPAWKGSGMEAPESMATPREVSAVLRVAVQTLAQWRSQGKGPAWSKIGHNVRYDWTDIRAYQAAQKRETAA
jgi:hypothetical protein